jgi:Cytochrome bd terminal oxidase subunit II
VGLAALFTLALHGSLWVSLKTSGDVYQRSRRFARRTWWAVLLMTLVITYFSFRIQPNLGARFSSTPWGFVFPAVALLALIGAKSFSVRGPDLYAFSLYIAGMLCSAAFGVFPYVLRSNGKYDYGFNGLQRSCGALRVRHWALVVDPRHAAGRGLFRVHVPAARWKGTNRLDSLLWFVDCSFNIQRRSSMIRILIGCVVCLGFSAATAAAADESYRPVPMLKVVEPDTAKVGDMLTATGAHLDKALVAGLYMIQGEKTIEVKMTSQTEEAIRFMVPDAVKPGRFQLMVLATGPHPQFLEEPVYFTVE